MSISSSNSSSVSQLYHCVDSPAAFSSFVAFVVTKIFLLLPLSLLILGLGVQRWRQKRSVHAMSHSDFFSYNLSAVELNCAVWYMVFLCGAYTRRPVMMHVGLHVSNMSLPGELLFHSLTCVERHLAVIHPVTFLRLRQSGGVRIRSVSAGGVWLLCLGWIGVSVSYAPNLPIIPFFTMLVFSILVTSFCSLSVLCVLIRPGPGETSRDRERVDQSKQRALHAVMLIQGALWLWFVGLVVFVSLDVSQLFTYTDGCVLMASGIWLSVPSSLVLPLLHLHRAGRLQVHSKVSRDTRQ